MASFSSPSRYLLAFVLLSLYLQVLDADSNLSLYFPNFGKDSNLESQLALYGDAKVVNDSSSIQIGGGSGISSNGRIVSKRPYKVVESNSSRMLSFSSYFVFSMTGKYGYGLAFVMFPLGFPLNVFDSGSMGSFDDSKMKFLAIEFDTFKDDKDGDVNDNHVGFDIESLVSVKVSNVSVKVSNVSSIHLKLNNGEKLQAWIDYEASSKRFEVRLSRLSDNRPLNPLLTYPIDLSNFWKDDEYILGLSSSRKNSSQCNVYSWSFRSRTTPHWMHSQPMDPEHLSDRGKELKVVPKRSDCALKIIIALIVGMGCGAVGAFFILFLWTVFGNRRPVVPEEIHERTDEFEYKKLNVVVDKTIEDGKK